MKKLKCAVVGVGYLGRFHAEKYALLPNVELIAVCDADKAHAMEIANNYDILAYDDYRQLVGKVDLVSVATPTSTHYEIANFFLKHGCHVLLEKPIADTIAEAEDLILLAAKNKLILQIGFLERFNPGYIRLHYLLRKPFFIEATRLAPFKVRGTDVDVILDLMIHDIDLVLKMIPSKIAGINAHGAPVLSNKLDMVTADLEFENGCVAHLVASRVNLKPKRKINIFQSNGLISCDFLEHNLTIYRKGKSTISPDLAELDMEKIDFEAGDAILDEIKNFIATIRDNSIPKVTGEDGKNALAVALEIAKIVEQKLHKVMLT